MAKLTSFANPQLFDARATIKLLESSARKIAATARNEVEFVYKKREATWKKKLEGADETMREAAKKERKAGQLKRKWQAHEQQYKEYEEFFTEHMGVVAFEKQLKTAAVHSAVDYGKSQHKQVLQEKEQSLAALEETMQKLEMDAELASKQMVEIRRDYSRKWKEQKCNVAAEEVERWEWT